MQALRVFPGQAVLLILWAWTSRAASAADAPEKQDPRALRPGDAVKVDFRYSRDWTVASISVANPRGQGQPITKGDLDALRRNRGRVDGPGGTPGVSVELIPRPQASDPLFVEAQLECIASGQDELLVVPRFSRIHYRDDRGREWTLRPPQKDASARARGIVRDVASRWRPSLADRLEQEMVEEQLLGAGLAFLHGETLKVPLGGKGQSERQAQRQTGTQDQIETEGQIERESDTEREVQIERESEGRSQTEVPICERALEDLLPAEFPEALRGRLTEFLETACARVVTPLARELKERGGARKFEVGSMAWSVDSVSKVKGETHVKISGCSARDKQGVTAKETLLFEAGTGIVLEATSLRIQDPVGSGSARFDVTRLETRLLSFKKAPPAKSPPVKSRS